VDTPEGEYFISRKRLRGAMDGDRVEVERLRGLEISRRKRAGGRGGSGRGGSGSDGAGGAGGGAARSEMLGAVRRVLERARETVVGTLRYADGLAVVRPCDERVGHDIFLDHRVPMGRQAPEGSIVVVRITTYPSRIEAACGYIEEVVGQEDDAGMGIEVIIRSHGFETVFPDAALEEAESLARAGVEASSEHRDARLERRDLRDRFIFTIDPEDARDFDDALSVDFVNGQTRLGVHIADVSAYVAWDSALDLAARRRATSVYLPDRVIPMLPPLLSDGLCSLRPHEDRLAFTVDMTLDADGGVVDCDFYPSLIRSSARLSYDEAQRLMDEEAELVPQAPLRDALRVLRRLSKKLTRRRLARGAIEFEGVEAKLSLDAQGVPFAVRLRAKTDATALVEEAMILANEQVAAFMLSHGAAMVYRVHDEPYAAALEELLPTLREFGYASAGAPQSSREIQAILEASAQKPEHHLVSTLLLRAMKRARYAPVCSRHFGLASDAYTHFTSPIRRYPDLMAHRLLRQLLSDEPSSEDTRARLGGICEHSSEEEREAEQATREATALKLCEYLERRVGERFTGIITAVGTTGLAVREDTTTAEGFIERDSLPEGFDFDAQHHRYHDPSTNTGYRLGQPVALVLRDSDRGTARLRFTIA
jgi:ribonuclease R